MSLFLNLFCLLLWIELSGGEMCSSCFCYGVIAECYISSCQSEIVKLPDIEIIKIRGTLCENHIAELQRDYYHNTIIELVDSSCARMDFNCRDNVQVHLTTTTTTSYPFAPVFPRGGNEDPANYYEEEEEDDNDDDDDDDDDDDNDDVDNDYTETPTENPTEETIVSTQSETSVSDLNTPVTARLYPRLYPTLPAYNDESWWQDKEEVSSEMPADIPSPVQEFGTGNTTENVENLTQ